MKKPDYLIIVDGSDITNIIKKNLIKLTITDKRGIESDKLTIIINDSKGDIELPPSGVNININIGYSEALSSKGIFIIDSVSHDGPPDKITINGHGADFRNSLKDEKFKSWNETTLGEMSQEISNKNKLTLAISNEASKIKIAHVDQQNESDMNLLTRLSKENDLIFTIKENNLLIKRKSDKKTASGKKLPVFYINRTDCKSHQFKTSDKQTFSAVTALYYNVKEAQEESYRIGSESGTNKTIKEKFSSQDEARNAASSELKRIQRSDAEISLKLSFGNELLIPDSKIILSGFKDEINAKSWIIDEITHNINDNGFTTDLKLEVSG